MASTFEDPVNRRPADGEHLGQVGDGVLAAGGIRTRTSKLLRHSAQNDARPVASDRHGTGRRQRPVQAAGRASAPWADRSSRRSSLASSTVTASPTALRTRSGHRPSAATTHSRWWTYSPPRASSHRSPEFSRVDTSSWGSGADETGDRVGGFADLGVGCGAPLPGWRRRQIPLVDSNGKRSVAGHTPTTCGPTSKTHGMEGNKAHYERRPSSRRQQRRSRRRVRPATSSATEALALR
jgi:hypothetical protein